jgi:maleylpyruvate isomerase
MAIPKIDTRFIDDCVAGCASAHQALLLLLDSISSDEIDLWCAQPSLLPQWSRGYVLAHLARNADSHSHLFSEAALGREGEQYAGGLKGRSEGIATEAKLSGSELVRRSRESIYQLEASWARSPGEAWLGNGKNAVGAALAISDLPLLRWREMEVHMHDLGVGFTYMEWNPLYVRYDLARMAMRYTSRLPMGMSGLPPIALALSENERLAWLLGRVTPVGLEQVDNL